LFALIIAISFFFSSRRRHTRSKRDWSSDVCSSDVLLKRVAAAEIERNVALDELEDANSELRRRLAAEEDLVVAEERARVAAALHDGLGHRLTSIGMSLDFSERMVERDPLRTREEISNARATASEALDEMRRVVRAMHPVTTDPEDPLGSLRA